MRTLYRYWADEIGRNPIVLAPLICFLATVGMNARTGYKLADDNLLIAAILASFAFVTAYGFTVGLGLRRWSARKTGLIAGACLGLAFNLFSAWQTMGINFADGAVKRDTKAKGVAVVQRQLASFEAERGKIGTVRPLGTIKAEVTLECEKKSKLYPDGVGPKCTALRGELAGAERAAELDRLIKAEMGALEGREQVAGGAPQFSVQMRLAQAAADALGAKVTVSAEHILFGFMLVLAIMIEGLASIGFWLVGSAHGPEADEEVDGGSFRSAPGGRLRGAQSPGAIKEGIPVDIGGAGRALPAAAEMLALPSFVAPESRPPGAGYAAGGSAHAAPIHINIGMPQQGLPQDAGAAGVGRDPQGGTAAVPSSGVRPAPRHDLPGLPADAPPVDRSTVTRELAPHEREAADVMLAFRAACVIAAPGGMVAFRNLYARYQHWAGERALDETAFKGLWPDLTGIALPEIGGAPHAQGVALRVGPRLQAVA